MKQLLLALVVCVAFSACAETWTWKGADGASWTEASSWQSSGGVSGVPTGTDTVVFDGTTGTVTLDGETSIGGFTTLNAAKFTVSGTGSITLANETTVFDFAANSDVTLDVVLAGDGQLYKQGYPTRLRLKKDNTFTGGVELKIAGNVAADFNYLHVCTDGALGLPADGKLIKAHRGSGYYFESTTAMTLDYDLWSDESFNDIPSFTFTCPSATVNGTVSFNDRVSLSHSGKGPYVYAKGMEVRTPKKDYCMCRGNGSYYPHIVFNDVFQGELFWHAATGCGYYEFNAPGNTPGTFPFEQMSQGRIACGAAEAFGPTTQFEMYSGNASLDLNGFDQTVTKFFGPSGTLKNTAATAATFVHAYDGTSKVTSSGKAIAHFFNGKTEGPLNYVFAPTSSEYVYAMTNATWNAAGAFIVSNGTLRAVNQSMPNLTAVAVTDGATLDLVGACSVDAAATLTVENGGTLRLAGTTLLTVDACTIRGVTIRRGQTCRCGDLPGLEGEGAISVRVGDVEQTSADWTGDGTDTKITTKANWENATLPDWTTGGLFTRIAGGSAMTLTEDAQFAGLDFAGGANPFAVESATGAETLSLFEKGLTTRTPESGSAVQTNVISAPVYLGAAQTFDVAANTALELSGDIATIGAVELRKAGAGELHLKGELANFGNFIHTNGDVHVWREGTLGSAEAGEVRWIRSNSAKIKPRFFLHDGAVISRPITMEIDSGNSASEAGEIVAADGVSEIAGKISRPTGNLILETRKGATLVVSGGMSGNWFMPYGYGTLVITNTPITRIGNGRSTIAAYNTSTTYVYTQGNAGEELAFGDYTNLGSDPIAIHLMVPDAFSEQTCLSFAANARANRVLHLHGNDQHFCRLTHRPGNVGAGTCVTSDAPVTVTFNQSKSALLGNNSGAATNAVPFCGPISMVKKGEFLLQIDGNQDKRSGSIEVQQSELVLNTAMPTVPSLSATGGKLVITANASFDRHVDVSVDGGKVDLADGVTMKCGWLYLDGKAEPEQPGTYGSSQSAAQFKDDVHFSGTGVLWARKGSGTLMLVR